MNDQQCIDFLQWCLPRMGYRWPGFRKVRKQVCKRIVRRILELKLADGNSYKTFLETNAEEWKVLDSFCYITISRFYRDKQVFDTIRAIVLPDLAQRAYATNEDEISVWSAGCCAGEEAYTLKILWELSVVQHLERIMSFKIVATDKDAQVLERARRAVYSYGSVKDLPKDYLDLAFAKEGEAFRLKDSFRENVLFLQQNIQKERPEGLFDLILCRNLVFTYFEEALQCKIMKGMLAKLKTGGILVIGGSEMLPQKYFELIPLEGSRGIFRKLNRS
ncbi:MAG: protein-glutamate O-methyltransferase CheR [Marinifilaceae bacterium]